MSRWNLAWLLGIPAVTLLCLALAHSAPTASKDQDYKMVRLLVEVLDEVDKNYVRELDEKAKRKLVEDMINGGLDHLDPHSGFMNPKEFKQFNTQSKGKFGGVGIQISADRQTGQLMVISPIVGTPAYEAGVLAGDVITKINGKTTDGMRLSEAVDLIQGEPGTEITISVRRDGMKDEANLTMKRAVIEMQSVMGDLRKADDPREWDWFVDKDSRIAYIRITAFSENTASDMRKVLDQLKKDGLNGLVLDLRNNPGGLLSGAVEVANLFLSEGRIVSTRGRNQKERVYDARPGDAILTPAHAYPMVVLVNRYSASASEIVAAALQDHGRAIVVGERTFGKGSVQNILRVENELSALKLTTASYWRPSGKNIHKFPDSKDSDEWGVHPSGFKLTDRALAALRSQKVSEAVLNKLKPLIDKEYLHEKDFVDALEKVLSTGEMQEHRDKLLHDAERLFEVRQTDEERIEYLIYRRDRDIVHGKPQGAPAPAAKPRLDKDGKEKPPFVDRVLERGLDWLRREIQRRGDARGPDPVPAPPRRRELAPVFNS